MRDASSRSIVFLVSLGLCYWSGGFAVQLGHPPALLDRPPDVRVPPTSPVEAGPSTTLYFPTESDQSWDAHLLCTRCQANKRFATGIRWHRASCRGLARTVDRQP
jgi:hypothetical protein